MISRGRKPGINGDDVGYGKPPAHTRFRKGQSGNPGGRPRGMTTGRANRLALKEAYRLITVREGEQVLTLPAIQAVMRQQVRLAAKGNGPAQRAIIETVQRIEREFAARTAMQAKEQADGRTASPFDVARRVAFLLTRAKEEIDQKERESTARNYE